MPKKPNHLPADYFEVLRLYKRIESARFRALRLLFDLTPEDIAFYVWSDGARTEEEVKKQCAEYYANLELLLKVEKDRPEIRQRRAEMFTVGEAAFVASSSIKEPKRFANKLRATRLRTGLSQGDVAFLLDIPSRVLSAFERATKTPDLRTAIDFSVLYQKPVKELFPQLAAWNARSVADKRKALEGRRRRSHLSHTEEA